MLHYRPCYAQAVERGRSAPDFVHKQQRLIRSIIENIGHLRHLHHESTSARRKVVACPYAGKYPVHNSYIARRCGNKATHLRHNRYERNLLHVDTFSRHVRTRYKHNLTVRRINEGVVRNKRLISEHSFNYRMSTLANIQNVVRCYIRLYVSVFARHYGKRNKTVEHCHAFCRRQIFGYSLR